jgi:hypothetical protein
MILQAGRQCLAGEVQQGYDQARDKLCTVQRPAGRLTHLRRLAARRPLSPRLTESRTPIRI